MRGGRRHLNRIRVYKYSRDDVENDEKKPRASPSSGPRPVRPRRLDSTAARTPPARHSALRPATMRGVRAARLRAFAFASAAFSLLSCEVFAQTPGASPLPPLFPGFSTEALSRDASSEDDFGALGAFDTAQSRVCIPATDGTAPSVAGVPDLGGETGEVLCTHPAVAETRKREPNARFPLVLYLHPTHGLVFEAWIAQNVAMLRLLASRGFVVCAPTMVGARGGEGTKAPIVGGLFPGAQHTAAVAERRVFPRLLAFAPHAAAQLVRLSALGSGSANDERDERDECAFPVALDRAVDPARIAFAGFSSGGALAVYAADAAERNWPGATRAVVALAPTVGDFAFAREQFERRTRTMRVPMMLVAGAEDGMGGLDGLVELGDAATRAPRVGVAVAGASHCHLYIPVGSECDLYDPSNDKGGVGALGRFATSAFLHAYFGFPGGFAAETTSRQTSATKASAAIDAAWGGAETLNRFGAGAWNARVLVEPLVELGLFHSARDKTSFSSRDVATASYAYDPTHDAWTATVLLRVAAKGKGCLTEARIVPAPEGFVPDAEHPRRASDSLRAFLNANPDAGEGDVGARRAMPAQPVGASVLVFPTPRDVGDGDDGEGDRGGIVGLVLEWRADAFDARGALRDAPRGPRRRLLGGTPGICRISRRVRLRARPPSAKRRFERKTSMDFSVSNATATAIANATAPRRARRLFCARSRITTSSWTARWLGLSRIPSPRRWSARSGSRPAKRPTRRSRRGGPRLCACARSTRATGEPPRTSRWRWRLRGWRTRLRFSRATTPSARSAREEPKTKKTKKKKNASSSRYPLHFPRRGARPRRRRRGRTRSPGKRVPSRDGFLRAGTRSPDNRKNAFPSGPHFACRGEVQEKRQTAARACIARVSESRDASFSARTTRVSRWVEIHTPSLAFSPSLFFFVTCPPRRARRSRP